MLVQYIVISDGKHQMGHCHRKMQRQVLLCALLWRLTPRRVERITANS